MSTQASVYRRIVRRETHSSRAGWAITVAIVLMLLIAAAGAAGVYFIVHPPLLAGLDVGRDALAGVRGTLRVPVAGAGVAALAIGVVLVVVAVTPGRRARHPLPGDRVAVVVDDKVVARALAKTAAEAARLPRRQIEVVTHRRRATVTVTPVAGIPVDRAAVAQAVLAGGARYGMRRTPRVLVSQRAVIG